MVLEATKHWGEQAQKEKIILACRTTETDVKGYKTVDDLMGSQTLEPHVYKDPKEELSYLCYSSGTTGLAKGVMTTVYNMTSVLAGLYPFMGEKDDVTFAFLPLSVSESSLRFARTSD